MKVFPFMFDEETNIFLSSRTTTYDYDSNGFLNSVIDPTGAVTQYKYDGIGRLLEITSPLLKTISYQYSKAGKLLSSTDVDGIVTQYNPNANGVNDTLTDKMGNTKHFTYNTMNAITFRNRFSW